MGVKFSEKELKRIVKQPDYAIVNGNEPRQPKQDLSKLLPEGSKHEVKFMQLWDLLNGPKLEREFRFCADRRYRADFAHVQTKLLIEIEGFGHQRQNRYTTDVSKYNLAAQLGYTVRRLTPNMINVNELSEIIAHLRAKEG